MFLGEIVHYIDQYGDEHAAMIVDTGREQVATLNLFKVHGCYIERGVPHALETPKQHHSWHSVSESFSAEPAPSVVSPTNGRTGKK